MNEFPHHHCISCHRKQRGKKKREEAPKSMVYGFAYLLGSIGRVYGIQGTDLTLPSSVAGFRASVLPHPKISHLFADYY